MKVLNLYAGIGGNRKLWTDCDVTAVEYDEETSKVYQDYFPNDEVIVDDAHQFLLDHYDEFDFIWSSPPCPSHSDIRRCGVNAGQVRAIYPEMSLYQEIILMDNFTPKHSKYIVENVRPYYTPLIPPNKTLHRHLYWCNFRIPNFDVTDDRKHNDISANSTIYGFELSKYKIKSTKKRKMLRNMVDPELGLHIFNAAKGIISKQNTEQKSLW